MSAPPLSPPLDLVTTAVLEHLRGAGRTVYDGAYGGDPVKPAYPYAILYRLAGGNSDTTPDLDDTRQTITVAYQVTAVSNLRNQCEHTARVLHDRLVGRTAGSYAHPLVMPAGWQCTDRRSDPTVPGIDRVGDPPTALYQSPARYLLTITPS